MRVGIELGAEPRDVELEVGRRSAQVRVLERGLVLEERRVHLEEPSLRAGGFGRFGGMAGMRVQVLEREVAEDEAELVRQDALELVDDGHRRAAVWTLVVAVFDQRHEGGRRPPNVVAIADPDGQARRLRPVRPLSVMSALLPGWPDRAVPDTACHR